MEQDYEVLFGGKPTGKVRVTRDGLYYRFCCRCRLSGDVVCRLYAQCGDKRENLGVVIPMEDGFGLETRLPVKRLGEGDMEFRLIPKSEKNPQGKFVPIYPEEPFAYLQRLEEAFLATQNGQVGAVIPEKAEEAPQEPAASEVPEEME